MEDGRPYVSDEVLKRMKNVSVTQAWSVVTGAGYRNCYETAVGWTLALQRKDGPTALVLTRQKVPPLERPESFKPEDALAGAYILCKEKKKRRKVVVATGSETAPALAAAQDNGWTVVSVTRDFERVFTFDPEPARVKPS